MNVHDAMIHKCTNVSILKDNMLRERRIEHDKYIILLDENIPFSADELVKIMRKFEEINFS